jgi:hypothetical protein
MTPANCLQTHVIVETNLDNPQAQVEVDTKLGVWRFIAHSQDV